MTAVLLTLFGYRLFDEPVHEWLGLVFIALIVSHLISNRWWLKTLSNGIKFNFQLLLNFALFLLFLTACISGILLSKHIFADFPFHLTDDFTRKSHLLSVHWIQIVAAMHLGLHWANLAGRITAWLKLDLDEPSAKIASRILLPLLWGILTVYGIYVFIRRDLFPYLINQVDFAFFPEEPQAVFYFDYFAILIAVAYLTHQLMNFTHKFFLNYLSNQE